MSIDFAQNEQFEITEIAQLNIKRGNIDVDEPYCADIFEALADKINALDVAYALIEED